MSHAPDHPQPLVRHVQFRFGCPHPFGRASTASAIPIVGTNRTHLATDLGAGAARRGPGRATAAPGGPSGGRALRARPRSNGACSRSARAPAAGRRPHHDTLANKCSPCLRRRRRHQTALPSRTGSGPPPVSARWPEVTFPDPVVANGTVDVRPDRRRAYQLPESGSRRGNLPVDRPGAQADVFHGRVGYAESWTRDRCRPEEEPCTG